MTVDIDDPIIDVFQKKSLYVSILLSLHIFQVVGDANYFLEFGFPCEPVMVPRKMLRLLKHRNVRLYTGMISVISPTGRMLLFSFEKLWTRRRIGNNHSEPKLSVSTTKVCETNDHSFIEGNDPKEVTFAR